MCTFKDLSGKEYKTVRIGNQVWMAENLAYEVEGSRCYDDDPANCQKYGRLYDWNAATKACPKGWHLPTRTEWDILTESVGGIEIEGEHLKAKSGWDDYEGKSGNGTDKYGFAALPGGVCYPCGDFCWVGSEGFWWSASDFGIGTCGTKRSTVDPYVNGLGGDEAYYVIILSGYKYVAWFSKKKSCLCSIRYVKDQDSLC